LCFLVDGGKFAVGQGFCRHLVVDARFPGAIRTTRRQPAIEQVGPAAQGVLKDLVPLPLVLVQLAPDDRFQPLVFQLCVEDAVLVGDLHRVGDQSDGVYHPDGLVPDLHLYPCGPLVLLFENLLQLCLYF